MSHGKLRAEKNCLDCGHFVEERFCPHCGQENTETRQPFHYLFTHFIEDFTHYDGQFWKTIKYLLFRPGKLTQEYLSGKRQMYVAPVKLYIFISFITFLLPGLLPKYHEAEEKEENTVRIEQSKNSAEKTKKVFDELQKADILSKPAAEASKKALDSASTMDNEDILIDNSFKNENAPFMNAHNLKEYDVLLEKDETSLYVLLRPLAKKMFELKEKGLSKKQIWQKYAETIVHTIPKALFVYLPVFAFFLWVFHNKKKWWYFDHGIFTLHYFSFLLLAISVFNLIKYIGGYLPDLFLINLIFLILYVAAIIYITIYFFAAHSRVYESSRSMSLLKGILLFMVNLIGLIIMFLILLYVSLITMH